ncbi:MAG TPA: phosphate/phosphite/phosphonate ABC transporter substrate-binding protein [Candidatus Methylomirabilis sp.]|nr:phosphate/phosphite/phosphonate ABC transporter substrate-binding protein [Candidatus Methylomirabilis sp.]
MRGKGRTVRNVSLGVAMFAAILVAIAAARPVPAASAGAVRYAVTISESAEITARKYQPLMDYLSKKTGRPFEVRTVKSYDDILALMKSGEADGGVLGSIAGSDALHHGLVVPVARIEKGGISTYRGYFIARKDGGAKKVEDLKGKIFDSNGGSASVGKFFPRKLLKDKKLDFDAFFSKVTASTKHDTVVYKVLNRDADCGTVKDSVFDKMAASDERVKNEIVILATSQKFPDGNVMFRKAAPAGLVKETSKVLLGMGKDPDAKPALDALGADRFIPSPAKEYERLGKMIEALEKK